MQYSHYHNLFLNTIHLTLRLCATLARIPIWTETLWPGHFGLRHFGLRPFGLRPFGQGHFG